MRKLIICISIICSVLNGQNVINVIDSDYFKNLTSSDYIINLGDPVSHNPLFYLLDTTYLIAGKDYTLYSDNIGNWQIGESFDYTYQCDICTDTTRGVYLSTDYKDIGIYELSVSYEGYSDTMILNVIPNNNSLRDTVSINIVGNSVTSQGVRYRDTVVNDVDGYYIKTYGTQGSGNSTHEGRSGWTYGNFLGSSSPYYNGSEINVTDYRYDSVSADTPFTFVPIQLGINDIIADDKDTSYINSTVMNRVAAFTTDFTNDTTEYTILCLTPKCENSGNGWFANYGTTRDQNFYMSKMMHYWKKLIEGYDNTTGGADIIISPQGYFIDRDGGYPKTAGVHTNGVHPNDTGDSQLGVILKSTIEGRLFNEGTELVTNNYFETWQGNAQPNDYPTGWTLAANDANNYFEQDSDNNLRLYCQTSSGTRISQTILTIGLDYKLVVVCSKYTSGNIRIQHGGTNAIVFFSEGVHVAEFTAAGTGLSIRSNGAGLDMNLSYISVKQINN